MRQSIWNMFKGRRLDLGSLLAVSILGGLCEAFLLAVAAEAAAAIVSTHHRTTMALPHFHGQVAISDVLLVSFGVAIVRLLLGAALSHIASKMCADVQADMRLKLFAAFSRASWSVQASDGEGRFQETATQQILQATNAVVNATGVLTNVTMLVILVGGALVADPGPATAVIAAAALLFIALRPFNRIGRQQAKILSQAQVSYAAGLHDAVELAEEAHVFGVGSAQEDHLSDLVRQSRYRFYTTSLLTRIVPNVYQGIIFVLLVAGLFILNASHSGKGGNLGAVVLLLLRASTYGQSLQASWLGLHQSYSFVDRIEDAVDRYETQPVKRGDQVLVDGVHQLAFRQVSYEYVPGTPVLNGLSFDIIPGETIGVVGPSGAGKSTLVQILLGLREPKGGSYLVNHHPAQDWSATAWTNAYAYVPQDPRLIQASVAENIRFFRDIPFESVQRAARLTYIHDDIITWKDGYDTLIGQRANAVSGGQRQRLCLARALAGHPSVIILDEPTSSLDPHSESMVQESLRALKGEVTLIIIAHRFSTLSICDRVMVLEHGNLAGFAPAQDLIQTNDYYRHAADLSMVTSA